MKGASADSPLPSSLDASNCEAATGAGIDAAVDCHQLVAGQDIPVVTAGEHALAVASKTIRFSDERATSGRLPASAETE